MSSNLIHSLFLGASAGAAKKNKIKKEKKDMNHKDEINRIILSSKDFYRKMNDHSTKKLAFNCLEKCIQDPELIRKKISKKKFLLGSNINFSKNKKIKKKKTISRKEIRKNNLFEFREKSLKYKEMLKLNELWEDYILDMIEKDKSEEAILNKVGKSDLHGAKIRIINSNNKNLIGIEGIVLKENSNSFLIISKDDKIKQIIKKNCVFGIFLKNKEIKIYGCILLKRIEERFKQKFNQSHIYNLSKDLINLI